MQVLIGVPQVSGDNLSMNNNKNQDLIASMVFIVAFFGTTIYVLLMKGIN